MPTAKRKTLHEQPSRRLARPSAATTSSETHQMNSKEMHRARSGKRVGPSRGTPRSTLTSRRSSPHELERPVLHRRHADSDPLTLPDNYPQQRTPAPPQRSLHCRREPGLLARVRLWGLKSFLFPTLLMLCSVFVSIPFVMFQNKRLLLLRIA